ncbi:hypothetical protein [Treponema sp.]|uniref:hypothetical protein n=1 Tax=Treponema sp. TaxID=166 RepID=UPI003890F6C9
MDFYDDEIEDNFEDDFDMSEFNGHLRGKRCDQCGSEEIYYDGEQYECSNCGMIWLDEDDIGDYEPDEYEIHDAMMREVLKSEKKLFQNSITKENLKVLFSTLSRFFKIRELDFDDPTPEFHYPYLLSQVMIDSPSYSAAKNVVPPDGISPEDRNNYFYGFMEDFMSAVDELPYKPNPEDWANYLKIDTKEVMNFFPKGDLDIEPYIAPENVIDNFAIIFSNKIRSIDEEAYEMCRGPINMDNCFSLYLCDNSDYGREYGFILHHFLADELAVAKRYLEGYKTKKAEFLQNAKDKNLSVIDTIMQFVYYAFEGSEIKL